jgi:hypothetical protein
MIFELRCASHLCLHARRVRLRAIDGRRNGLLNALRRHGGLWLGDRRFALGRVSRLPVEWLCNASHWR